MRGGEGSSQGVAHAQAARLGQLDGTPISPTAVSSLDCEFLEDTLSATFILAVHKARSPAPFL